MRKTKKKDEKCCPVCGACPHCGARPAVTVPVYVPYPYYVWPQPIYQPLPIWTQPVWPQPTYTPTWTITGRSVSSDTVSINNVAAPYTLTAGSAIQ